MTPIKIALAIIIHIAIPTAGVIAYLKLLRRIKDSQIENPPVFDLFLIFATYGGLLLVVLTSFFWLWSGMASLGLAYLVLGAPIVMGFIAHRNYKLKHLSEYHVWTFQSAAAYFVVAPITFFLLFLLLK